MSTPSQEGEYAEQAEDTGLNAKAGSIPNRVKSLKRACSKGQNCLGEFRLYYPTREEDSSNCGGEESSCSEEQLAFTCTQCGLVLMKRRD